MLHREHASGLERRVGGRAHADRPTVEDACSFAWMQLLTHHSVELASTHRVLGWLTVTATREVWRLGALRVREFPQDHDAIEGLQRGREQFAAAADAIASHRERLGRVEQLPARSRRFIVRLASGYSHREIAAAEHASATTTNKQITRAKRLLRAADADLTMPRPQPPAATARGARAPERIVA